MNRRRWIWLTMAGTPLLVVSSCFRDEVILRVLADDIVGVILGASQTIVGNFFNQLFGVT